MRRLGKLPQKGRLFVAYLYKNPETLLSYMGSHVDQNLDKLLAIMGKDRKDFFQDFSSHKVIGGWADYKGNFYDNPNDADKARFRTLKEDPDQVLIPPETKSINNKNIISLYFHDSDTYAFGYFSTKLFKHFMTNDKNFRNFRYYNEVPKDNTFFIGKKWHQDLIPSRTGWVDRNMFRVCGRLWTRSKVITFWGRVSKQDVKKLIQDIYRKTRIKITNDWIIEYGDRNFKRIGDYLGIEKRNPIDRSKQHTLSPNIKDRNRDKSNSGSQKYRDLANKLKYNSVAQMNYYNKHNLYELKLTKILEKL